MKPSSELSKQSLTELLTRWREIQRPLEQRYLVGSSEQSSSHTYTHTWSNTIDWLTDWLIDWLIHSFIHSFIRTHVHLGRWEWLFSASFCPMLYCQPLAVYSLTSPFWHRTIIVLAGLSRCQAPSTIPNITDFRYNRTVKKLSIINWEGRDTCYRKWHQ